MKLKQSIICAGIDAYAVDTDRPRTYIPKTGDVGIFEVVSVGKHTGIQNTTRRISHIFPGDRIMAAFGNRYATSQFEGYAPAECRDQFHILGQGGVIGIVASAHVSMPDPTVVKIIGYAVDACGQVINTKYRRHPVEWFTGSVPHDARVVLSLGSSMDSGKTTTAGHLARSLKAIGKTVAYLKVTGTAFTRDMEFCGDCGADFVNDFSWFGFPSTYMCDEDELLDLYQGLLNSTASAAPDYIIVEVADGLYQRETNLLLHSRRFVSTVQMVVFSAVDSLSAVNGARHLAELGLPPVLISGRFTMSPLLIEEVTSVADVKVASLQQIVTPPVAQYLEACAPVRVSSRP